MIKKKFTRLAVCEIKSMRPIFKAEMLKSVLMTNINLYSIMKQELSFNPY